MKTQNNNKKSFIIGLAAFALIGFTHFSALADPEKKLKESVDSTTIEEALIDLEDVDVMISDFETMDLEQFVEIYNDQDQLVFSGSIIEYENMDTPEGIQLKRKADFLFESGNTKVYKVF